MPAGAPSKYKEEYCEDILTWSNLGELPIDWAKRLGCHVDTLRGWCERHDKFSLAYKNAMNNTEQHRKNKMENADSMLEFNKQKFMLSAYHRVSETQKIEAKTETSVTNDIKISFADRD